MSDKAHKILSVLNGLALAVAGSLLKTNTFPSMAWLWQAIVGLTAGGAVLALKPVVSSTPAKPAGLPLPPGSSLRALLPLAFVALACSSCAGVDWKKFGVDEAMCLASPVKSAIGDVSSDLVTSIEQEIQGGNGFDSAQWKNDAQALGLKYGFGVVACAAEHLVGDLFIAGPVQVCTHKQAKPEHLAYLRKLLPKR